MYILITKILGKHFETKISEMHAMIEQRFTIWLLFNIA